MTAAEAVFVYELVGATAESVVDWLHVHAEVQGVLEGETSWTVWLAAPLPELPPAVRGELVLRRLAVDPAAAAITGLEQDVAILLLPDLLVRPPWVPRPAGFAGVELVVPRGNAFGSGEHASTQAALLCLHAVWAQPESCADIGTGSGILALYASQRGCRQIQACDIELPAVQAARELLPSANVQLGGPELLAAADCVIANMTAAELHAALPAIRALWTGRSHLVLSGLRTGEVEPMLAALPLPLQQRIDRPPFTALAFAPQGPAAVTLVDSRACLHE